MGKFKKNAESSAGNSVLGMQKPYRNHFDYDSLRKSNANQTKNAESTLDSADSAISKNETNSSIFDEKSGLRSHEREDRTNSSSTKRVANLPDLSQKDAEFAPDSAPLPKNTKLRSFLIGASGLSLGISIVVAIMLGIGAGILMQKIFKVAWVLFLGVFWGIAAAVLNVYKVYKAELRDFEKLANDPKYKY